MSSVDNTTPTNKDNIIEKPTQDNTTPFAADSTPSSASPSGTSTPTGKPSSTSSTPKPAASRKPRCNFKSCNALAQRVVGDCGFCNLKFCGKHRLLESHACSGLEDCKDEARERNKERLETERTTMVRGV